MSLTKDVIDARDSLMRLTELMVKPKVRNDPVVKALLKGMTPEKSEFAQASLAVSTLRNAGCIEQSTGKDSSADSGGPKDQTPKPEKEKKTKEKSEKPQKLRGFARAIDLLIEDDLATGQLTNGTPAPKEKMDHPLAKKLIELRADPDREIEVRIINAEFETGTYPNGKKYNKFKNYLYAEKDGKTAFALDQNNSGLRKVKDLSDWDLIALEAPDMLKGGILAGKPVAFSLEHMFGWAIGPESTRKLLESSVADVEKTYPSLKGTPLIEMIKSFGFPLGTNQRAVLLTELSKLPWAQFGPSTTMWWEGKKLPKGAPLPQHTKGSTTGYGGGAPANGGDPYGKSTQ